MNKATRDFMESMLPKIDPKTESLLPAHDAKGVCDQYSCFIPDHGYFYLIKEEDTGKWLFMKEGMTKRYKAQVYVNGHLDGSKKVERFISCSPTSIIIQFYGHFDLLLVSTINLWTTVEIQKKPTSYLKEYLGLNNLKTPPALKGLREKAGTNIVFESQSDGGFIEGHTSILKKKWGLVNEVLASLDRVPTEDHPVGLTTEYPTVWMEAMFDFLYGERKPLDWHTAQGVMALGNVWRIPELRAYGESWLYFAQVTQFDAFNVWRQIHTFSEGVANHSINRIKWGGQINDRYTLLLLVAKLTPELSQKFVGQFCPKVEYE